MPLVFRNRRRSYAGGRCYHARPIRILRPKLGEGKLGVQFAGGSLEIGRWQTVRVGTIVIRIPPGTPPSNTHTAQPLCESFPSLPALAPADKYHRPNLVPCILCALRSDNW